MNSESERERPQGQCRANRSLKVARPNSAPSCFALSADILNSVEILTVFYSFVWWNFISREDYVCEI